jgi:competence protein ComEA
MIKKLFAFFAALSLSAAFAAVDVNKGTEAELDSIKGIGPAKSRLIIAERKNGEFKNWDDFIARVKGVGDKVAARYSAEGLTVGGASYAGPAAKATIAKGAAAADTVKKAAPAAVAATAATPVQPIAEKK